MKNYQLTATFVVLLSAFGFTQNLPVSQNQEQKKVVIEEFTAFKCGYCPAAHEEAREIGENLGEENVLVIGYHFGSLGAPSAGEPDLRTPEAVDLVNFFGVFGQPNGPVNRGSFGESTFALAPNSWVANSNIISMENADANVALTVEIDPSTRIAHIQTEVFYVNTSSTTHYLTIGYYENTIIAPQTTYNASWNAAYFNPDGSYNHKNVFRGFNSSREGMPIDASQIGVISQTLIDTIPIDLNGVPINLDNLAFFAILHEGENTPTNSNVVNAAKTGAEIVVGIDEIESETQIFAFPNPSNGVFKLNKLNPSDELTIVDVLGRSVPFEQDGNQITVLEKGIFLIQIESSEKIQTLRLKID